MIGKDQTPDVGKDTQWKEGESGNPAGKPPGTVHLSTRIQQMLNDPDFTTDMVGRDGKKVKFKGMPIVAIIKTAQLKAMSGNKQWADWLAENGYGRKFEVAVKGNLKINVVNYDDGQRDDDNDPPQV